LVTGVRCDTDIRHYQKQDISPSIKIAQFIDE
jgi:hypothetical protein